MVPQLRLHLSNIADECGRRRRSAPKRIVTASDDRTARVWNADGSGDPIVLKGHNNEIRFAEWSSDGNSIITASWDMTARIWLLTVPTLREALRDATTACLTPEQRHNYLIESEADARKTYEACEHAHGRSPFYADAP